MARSKIKIKIPVLYKQDYSVRPSSLFHFDGMPFFSSVRIINDIVLIHHSPCQSSIGKCGKALYFCLSCGSQSSHTSGRLQDKGCKARKCPSVNNPSKDIVESSKDCVGYQLNNSYQSAMGAEQNKTEDSGQQLHSWI